MSYIINDSLRARYYSSEKHALSGIRYIVLHYTGNDGTTATAKGNANYFANCPRKASAHYVVDEHETVYHCVPDNHAAWSVGDSGAGTLKKKCTNYNSISIEMVSHSNSNGYYIPAETIKRSADLTRALMQKYHVPVDRVIRHYDVTGKLCPATHCGTATGNANWKAFKALLVMPESDTDHVASKEETEVVVKTPFVIEGEKMKLDAITKDGNTFVDLKQICKRIGLQVGYKSDTKERIIDFEKLKLTVDGKDKNIPGVITAQGHSYGSVSDLALLLNYITEWDSKTGITLKIATKHENYTEDEGIYTDSK